VGSAQNANPNDARRLLAQARLELDRNNLAGAQQLAERAKNMNVKWNSGEVQPWQVLMQIDSRRRHREQFPVAQAGYEGAQAFGTSDQPGAVQQGVYRPEGDPSRVVAASNVQPALADPTTRPNDDERRPNNDVSQGRRLYEQGLMAMENQDSAGALELFRQAWRFENELDPETRQQLKDKLTYLNAAQQQPANGEQPSPIEEINSRQQIVQRQMFSEITNAQRLAENQRAEDPLGALNNLQKLRGRVNSADLDPAAKKQFLTFVDNSIREIQVYIEQNKAEIELDRQNSDIIRSIDRDQQEMLAAQDLLAKMVDDFNNLMDERRFAEAEVVAKQAREIAPENPVVVNMVEKSRLAKSIAEDLELKEQKENGFVGAINSVVWSGIPRDDRDPIEYPKDWEGLTRTRERMNKRERERLSPEEIEIQKSLNTKVNVSFTEVPLQEALSTLCSLAGVPMYIDPQGLAVEAVTTDQPVTIVLSKDISLKSALNLILDPLRLSYVVDDDVLKITSESARNTQVYVETYNVADLVIPIPNFVPGYNVGLPAALREAYATLGQYQGSAVTSGLPLTIAADELQGASPNPSVLAQLPQTHGYSGMRSRPNQYSSMGAGGMGGAALADFDTLIELITSTVATDSWEENGGNGAIEPFPTNLSLVISQTQDVHEQIADLLEQLRRLQDLQVTIEVRFITLNDDFFERIGVDFDFDIDDNTGLSTRTPIPPDDTGPSIVFGLDPLGNPTNDLDLQFTQDSFGAAVPQFGGFDAATAANFGFAILSDIEVFFLLQAAQGDRRTNVLQAPKVTLFDGQSASVADQSNRPFVVGIIPVVGDFAAAHQPVVTVLSEGTSLSVQAVVSHDRRFVRLTLVPFFSQIGNVDTFRFVGSTTSDTGTNILDGDGNPIGVNDNVEQTTEGAVVQLPTFSFTTVSTTVNVPDGGTVLLGGIKRLSEGRNERGVPMLSKLPYVSRLFKNVGIGRNTQSLMLMVTPRIIIQAEEEAKLGVETQ
jgi:general secretion pathway protein D